MFSIDEILPCYICGARRFRIVANRDITQVYGGAGNQLHFIHNPHGDNVSITCECGHDVVIYGTCDHTLVIKKWNEQFNFVQKKVEVDD